MRHLDLKKIKEFRDKLKMTQDELAKAMSTPEERIYPQQISEWENRKTGGIRAQTLMRLATALHKSTEDFFIDTPTGA